MHKVRTSRATWFAALLVACETSPASTARQTPRSDPSLTTSTPAPIIPEPTIPAATAPTAISVATTPTVSGGAIPSGGAPQVALLNPALRTRPQWSASSDGTPVHSQTTVATVPGGLSVSANGQWALVSDPERSQLYTVDLDAQSVQTLSLDADVEPGRSVAGADSSFYVLGRRSGEVLLVNTADGQIAQRARVCAAPRGLAYVAQSDELRVACRSGLLLTLDAASLQLVSSVRLSPDLRDIVPLGENFLLTRFRSAELLLVDTSGQVLDRRPALGTSCSSATTAYRAVASGEGQALVVHQRASDYPVTGSSNVYYQSGCEGMVVVPGWTRVSAFTDPEGVRMSLDGPGQIDLSAGALDLALNHDRSRVALLGEAGAYTSRPVLHVEALGEDGNSTEQAEVWDSPVDPIAVAFDREGQWFYFSRQPAELRFEDGTILALSEESRADTGRDMFQMAPRGISCAACHPEGEEDGRTWSFVFGDRRTQGLVGGVLAQGPYHWDGSLSDFRALTDQVLSIRMGLGLTVPDAYVDALAGWTDTLPAAPYADVDDPEAVTRGKQLFENETLACSKCHPGPLFTDNASHDVGTGQALVTPTLLGLGLRSPLMHDGCAPDLAARFGACGGGDAHGVTSSLTGDETADLMAYLETL